MSACVRDDKGAEQTMPRSPRQVRREVQEAVTETVRDLPIHAVRLAMFGVGRALLLSDRVTKDVKQIRESGVRPVLGRWKDDAEEIAGALVHRVVDRINGNGETDVTWEPETPVARPPRKVSPLSADSELAVGKPAPVIEPEPAPVAVAEPAPVAAPEPAPVAELPVPNYDSSTLASIRARLRALDVAQVQTLRDYEQANAARADFVRMFDNRIAKLQA
jgi:hypothetical protein